jgi:hypothetical protein
MHDKFISSTTNNVSSLLVAEGQVGLLCSGKKILFKFQELVTQSGIVQRMLCCTHCHLGQSHQCPMQPVASEGSATETRLLMAFLLKMLNAQIDHQMCLYQL